MTNALTPLSELSPVGDPIAWRLDPGPNYNPEKIGINLQATESLARFIGLGRVVVLGYQGEQSQIQTNKVTVTGANSDGSATGAADISVTRGETHRVSFIDEDPAAPPQCRWPTALIDINRAELASRVSDHIRLGADREPAWSRNVDELLRRGLVTAAWSNLVGKPLGPEAIIQAGIVEGLFMSGDARGVALGGLVFVSSTYVPAFMYRRRFDREARVRHSMLPAGLQLDRFVIGCSRIGMSRIVRPITG
jgi:hypothetical protein